MESYAQSHGKELSDTVWNNYVYGDWTQENTSARLASGLDQLELVEQADFTALTTSNGTGGRLIQMVASGNSYNNAITLGHESYRDGIIGTASQQSAETLAATTAHTQMALRMLGDGKKDQIQMTENLAMDITAYKLSQYLGDDSIFAGYVAKNYDASADYWKLMMYADGTHEITFDGKKELSIDYFDEAGNKISTMKPAGQDMTDVGMAGALAKIIGFERAQEIMSGVSLDNVDLYDDDTLRDTLGMSDSEIFAARKAGKINLSKYTDSQKYNLVGEAMMKRQGAQWNYQQKQWEQTGGISYTITDKYLGEGKILAEVNSTGQFEYSTVTATVYRHPDSWKSIVAKTDENGNVTTWIRPDNQEYQKLDTITFEKKGVNTSVYERYTVDGYQTVDNMITNSKNDDLNQPYFDEYLGWVQGNTIVSSTYNMGYYTDYRGVSANYKGNVLVINNARTIAGYTVDNNGHGVLDDGRWLGHSNRGASKTTDWENTSSDGCSITSYTNHMNLTEKLESWGLNNGYQIGTRLYDVGRTSRLMEVTK